MILNWNRRPRYWLLALSLWIGSAVLGLAVEPVAAGVRPPEARGGRCEGAFTPELRAELPPGPKLPDFVNATSLRGYAEYRTPKGLLLQPYFVRHIFHGDVSQGLVTLGGKKYRALVLGGGMHTRQALAAFLARRPDVVQSLNASAKSSVIYENGVLEVVFPQAAFAEPTQSNRKTFFPENWSTAEVIAAIDHAYKLGFLEGGDPKVTGAPPRGSGDLITMIGFHKGVKIKIVFRNNAQPELISAYPLAQ